MIQLILLGELLFVAVIVVQMIRKRKSSYNEPDMEMSPGEDQLQEELMLPNEEKWE